MAEEPEETEEHDGLQMSFLDHLDELRKRLIQSVLAITIAFAVGFGFADRIYDFLAVPVKTEAKKYRLARESKLLGEDTRVALTQNLKEGDTLLYTFAMDSVLDKVKVPAGTSVQAKIVNKNGKLVAVLAQNWILGKTVIPQDRELIEVLGEAAVLPGFDVRDELVITKVGGAFTLTMTVALYTAIALAIPFLLYQIWAFVAPGLYQHEKKYVIPVLTMGTVLFIIGATFAYKIAFPAACNFLLGWQEGFQSLLNAEDYLDLILIMMLGFGIAFQIPTLSFILGRVGLITPKMLLRWWRHAIVLIVIIAAIITPTPDPTNLMIFTVPMWALYFLSVGIVWMFGKPRQTDEEVGDLATNE
ncbi:MAG: twin-arginine translocase subunit TatC [Blastocatellia bacterium]|nr:twin-arginine translocase subunit TatC [Blastocatellia bacterium]